LASREYRRAVCVLRSPGCSKSVGSNGEAAFWDAHGALVSKYGLPGALKPFYGGDPTSYMVFFRLKLS